MQLSYAKHSQVIKVFPSGSIIIISTILHFSLLLVAFGVQLKVHLPPPAVESNTKKYFYFSRTRKLFTHIKFPFIQEKKNVCVLYFKVCQLRNSVFLATMLQLCDASGFRIKLKRLCTGLCEYQTRHRPEKVKKKRKI